MLPETHKFIIQHALDFKKRRFRKYRHLIEAGCANEDNLRFSLEDFQLFGFDHFYHPDLKSGYSRFAGNAKKKGLFLFNKSLKLYKEGKFEQAFLTLGRSTHYLMDLASPAHTKLIFHLIDDDFENYTDNHIHKFSFKIRSRLIRPFTPKSCFQGLARKSQRTSYKKKNNMISIFFRQKPDKNLDKMSRELVKLSIIYTIALLNAFNRRIIKYTLLQENKKIIAKIKSGKNQIITKIKSRKARLVKKIKSEKRKIINKIVK